MSLTALDLSPEALKKYRPLDAIRRRKVKMRDELSKRRRRALVVANKAARLLRSEFEAREVILFGSLARRGTFTLFSDIDLAVRGIPASRFYAATSALVDISEEFTIDLVDLENCSSALLKSIEKDGKAL